LIDPGSPGGGGCTLALLAEPLHRIRSVRQDALIFGTAKHMNLARRCGVRPAGRFSGAHLVPTSGTRALRRWVAESEQVGGKYDVVHAWTARMAALASHALPERRRVGTLSVGPVIGGADAVLGWLLRRHPMPLFATSSAVQREYLSMGIDADEVTFMPPAVNPQSVEAVDRQTLRRRWRVEPKELVIALLSEPISWADARFAVHIAMRVFASDRRVRVLMHPQAWRRNEAELWDRQMTGGHLVIMEDELAEPWRIMRGADVALMLGSPSNVLLTGEEPSTYRPLWGGWRRQRPMPGVMPVLWAMAAGVPVISETSHAVADVIEDGVNGLLVNQHEDNAVCDRLARIYDDRTIANRIGAEGRKTIDRRFHVSAWCVRLKELWERTARLP
jgi:hypothetical protein